jgi:hypothetical protein
MNIRPNIFRNQIEEAMEVLKSCGYLGARWSCPLSPEQPVLRQASLPENYPTAMPHIAQSSDFEPR